MGDREKRPNSDSPLSAAISAHFAKAAGDRRCLLAHVEGRWLESMLMSYKGAQPCNRLADDQRVHLPGALIGIDCFSIGDEPPDVVL